MIIGIRFAISEKLPIIVKSVVRGHQGKIGVVPYAVAAVYVV